MNAPVTPTPASGRISPLGINPQNADDSPAKEEKKEDSPPQVPPKNEVIAARKPVPVHDRENNYLNSMKSTLFSRSNTVRRPATAQGRDNISAPIPFQVAPIQSDRSDSPARPARHESSAGGRARANSDERLHNKPWTPPSSNGSDLKVHSEMPLVKIPNGFLVEQAAVSLSDSEITELQDQVRDQSKPFGILKHSEVVALREVSVFFLPIQPPCLVSGRITNLAIRNCKPWRNTVTIFERPTLLSEQAANVCMFG